MTMTVCGGRRWCRTVAVELGRRLRALGCGCGRGEEAPWAWVLEGEGEGSAGAPAPLGDTENEESLEMFAVNSFFWHNDEEDKSLGDRSACRGFPVPPDRHHRK
jgi:hypothetical protein